MQRITSASRYFPSARLLENNIHNQMQKELGCCSVSQNLPRILLMQVLLSDLPQENAYMFFSDSPFIKEIL